MGSTARPHRLLNSAVSCGADSVQLPPRGGVVAELIGAALVAVEELLGVVFVNVDDLCGDEIVETTE